MLNLTQFSSRLYRDKNGIWQCSEKGNTPVSYPETGHQDYIDIEDHSFWYQHRCRVLVKLMHRFTPTGPIVDIGGGNGMTAHAIQNSGLDVIVVEPGPIGATNARMRGVQNVICASFEDAGFHAASLPAISLLDVLEHIQDDDAFLMKIYESMQKGGYLYLLVPAGSWLWSAHDIYVGHFRRYCLQPLCAKLRQSGFEISFASHLFLFLIIPIFLLQALPGHMGLIKSGTQKRLKAVNQVPSGVLGRWLNSLLNWELKRIHNGQTILQGSSCMIVAKKPL
ncbi:MAG: class I SAM-dependent methyltransferase [Magnetococcales bacterium]|nr:class I SAM-dependent methyltransferase [Magnetococcales bacterium]